MFRNILGIVAFALLTSGTSWAQNVKFEGGNSCGAITNTVTFSANLSDKTISDFKFLVKCPDGLALIRTFTKESLVSSGEDFGLQPKGSSFFALTITGSKATGDAARIPAEGYASGGRIVFQHGRVFGVSAQCNGVELDTCTEFKATGIPTE
jgi:hypothetical protein